MPRWVLGVEYDGTPFSGWQRQKHSRSVQEALEQALSYVANHPVTLSCAGRTDAGVHACEQIAHFDSTAVRDQKAWIFGSNCRLPETIRILWIEPIEDAFHARFSAIARQYRYVISNTYVRSALYGKRSCWEHRQLDVLRMQSAANIILGEHDFSAFRAAGCQAKSPVRKIHCVDIHRNDELIMMDIKANAFLHHMVRNIAGSLMKVGSGGADELWFKDVLDSKDRKLASKTADACGLYFIRAFYPEQYELPQQQRFPTLYKNG